MEECYENSLEEFDEFMEHQNTGEDATLRSYNPWKWMMICFHLWKGNLVKEEEEYLDA
jgi:hypothetical protein